MIGMVLVTHGNIGTELLKASNSIVGPQKQAEAIGIMCMTTWTNAATAILAAIKDVNTGKGVVLLTDMFGGTPSNLAIASMPQSQAVVLAGVNLPMLVKLASVRGDAAVARCRARSGNRGPQIHPAGVGNAGAVIGGLNRMDEIERRRRIVQHRDHRQQARACMRAPPRVLSKSPNDFKAEITVAKDEMGVSARSIMGLMMLAATQGSHDQNLRAAAPKRRRPSRR